MIPSDLGVCLWALHCVALKKRNVPSSKGFGLQEGFFFSVPGEREEMRDALLIAIA